MTIILVWNKPDITELFSSGIGIAGPWTGYQLNDGHIIIFHNCHHRDRLHLQEVCKSNPSLMVMPGVNIPLSQSHIDHVTPLTKIKDGDTLSVLLKATGIEELNPDYF